MNKYFTTMKRYNKGVRKAKLETSGNKFYVNSPENAAATVLNQLSRTFSKRGYPDLTIYNEDGSIYGFIEIKPNDQRALKAEQKLFSEFCHKHSIPFIRWCPADGVSKIETFLNINSTD